MPENNSDEMIKFAATGKPAKFGDAFGDLMKDKVNAGVEAIRAKVAAKLAGLDPTGEVGDGAFIDVRGVGGLDTGNKTALSQKISSLLSDTLGIDGKRIYFNFTNFEGSFWGHGGVNGMNSGTF